MSTGEMLIHHILRETKLFRRGSKGIHGRCQPLGVKGPDLWGRNGGCRKACFCTLFLESANVSNQNELHAFARMQSYCRSGCQPRFHDVGKKTQLLIGHCLCRIDFLLDVFFCFFNILYYANDVVQYIDVIFIPI